MSSARIALLVICAVLAGCGGSSQTNLLPTSSSTPLPPPAPPAPPTVSNAGRVFTLDNAASGNSVVVYSRSAVGTLTRVDSVPTGGLGLGHGLENQGALTISASQGVLLAVNPGNNDVSAFRVPTTGLVLASRMASAGSQPISVTEFNGLVYVLNAGSPNSVSGFHVDSAGNLAAIPGSTRALSANSVSPAQLEFSPDGKALVVAERTTGLIDMLAVGADGTLSAAVTVASAGTQPFGFAFRNDGVLVVSEAGAGTASSYNVDSSGRLQVISSAVPTNQTTACWVAISRDGNFAFVANTASASISTMSMAPHGDLTLLHSIAATTGGGPLDLAVSSDNRFLTVVTTTGEIDVFSIDQISGALSKVQSLTGLPTGSSGMIDP